MATLSSGSAPDERDGQTVATEDPEAREVLEALFTTVHAIYRWTSGRIAHAPSMREKLTGPRLRVLFAIKEAGTLRMGDLAAHLGVAARTVTDLVDGLEREGLVARRPDPSDRRAILLELSASARAQWEQLRVLHSEISREVLAPLDDDARRQLLALLDRLKEGPIRETVSPPWWDDQDRQPHADACDRRPPYPS